MKFLFPHGQFVMLFLGRTACSIVFLKSFNKMLSQLRSFTLTKSLGLVAIAVALAGCGEGGDFSVAPVTGVVQCNGQPVPGGLIFFEPKQTGDSAVVGKVGLGIIDESGNFTVSTYGDGDGAVVGLHRVKVEKGSGPGCACAMNADKEVAEVEVTADGENVFTIDLPKKTSLDVRAEKLAAEEDEEDD